MSKSRNSAEPRKVTSQKSDPLRESRTAQDKPFGNNNMPLATAYLKISNLALGNHYPEEENKLTQ
jgi:hypothetical protein